MNCYRFNWARPHNEPAWYFAYSCWDGRGCFQSSGLVITGNCIAIASFSALVIASFSFANLSPHPAIINVVMQSNNNRIFLIIPHTYILPVIHQNVFRFTRGNCYRKHRGCNHHYKNNVFCSAGYHSTGIQSANCYPIHILSHSYYWCCFLLNW